MQSLQRFQDKYKGPFCFQKKLFGYGIPREEREMLGKKKSQKIKKSMIFLCI